MTRNDIIRELQRRGYKAESRDNIKNGVVFEGVVIGDNQIAPIIYTKALRMQKSVGKTFITWLRK